MDLYEELKPALKLEPIEREDLINELAKKYGKTKKSLNEQIEVWRLEEIKQVKDKKEQLQKDGDSYKKFLIAQEKPEYKSLGCGIHEDEEGNEFYYFGGKAYNHNHGMDMIIGSNNKCYINSISKDGSGKNEIADLGINYRYPFIDSVLDYTWSNNSTPFSINSFLFGDKQEVTLKECYEDILHNNREFMDYPEDIIQISISCDILSSYFLECFESKGRSFYNSEKGSGKTTQALLYDLQMFNPIMSADMSGASYFRIIEGTCASVIIDDFDAIEDEKKQSQIQVARVGYKKGSKAVRCLDNGDKTPASFSLYNSMVINNVGGLDDITQDRCNTYYLIKSTEKKVDKKFNGKDIKWKIERDKKYYCALLHWKEVKETYEKLEVKGISGRDFERVAPILTIGKLVLDKETYEKLVEFELGRVKEIKTKDVSQDWLFQAIQEVVKQINNNDGKTIELRLDNLVRIIHPPERKNVWNNELKISELSIIEDEKWKTKNHSISIFLGKIFKNTPLFKSSTVHGGFVKYTFEPLKVGKFLEIRGYTSFFPEKELQYLIPPIQPIQSIQSIQPIQSIQDKKDDIYKNGEVGEVGEVGLLEKSPFFTQQDKEIMEEFG